MYVIDGVVFTHGEWGYVHIGSVGVYTSGVRVFTHTHTHTYMVGETTYYPNERESPSLISNYKSTVNTSSSE